MTTYSKTCLTETMCGDYTRYYLQTCDYQILGYKYEPKPDRTCVRQIEGNYCSDCVILMDCCARTNMDCCQRIITAIPSTVPSNVPTSMPSYFCNNKAIEVSDNTCGTFQILRSKIIHRTDGGNMLCCSEHAEFCCEHSYMLFVFIGGMLMLTAMVFHIVIYLLHDPERNKQRVVPLNNILPQ